MIQPKSLWHYQWHGFRFKENNSLKIDQFQDQIPMMRRQNEVVRPKSSLVGGFNPVEKY